jgi:protein SCO1/2
MSRGLNRIEFRAVFFIFLLAAVACSALGPSFKGQVVDSTPAPEINMIDQYGNSFQSSDQQGRVILLFFGFTNCVDECPLTLAHLKLALELLGESADQIQVVMVSTDPVRDSRKALHDFLGKFNPNFLGITGSVDELSNIWSDYGVVVLDGGETHSSYTYVIDQQGNLRLHFDPEMAPEDIASDLEVLLAGK